MESWDGKFPRGLLVLKDPSPPLLAIEGANAEMASRSLRPFIKCIKSRRTSLHLVVLLLLAPPPRSRASNAQSNASAMQWESYRRIAESMEQRRA